MSLNAICDFWQRRDDARELTGEQLAQIKQTFFVVGDLRPIGRAPGYAVSDDGRVFSGLLCSWQRKKCPRELRPVPHVKGYRLARLHINKRITLVGIHCLVAEAFLSPPGQGQVCVRHLDGQPANNQVGNLSWGTRLENAQDMIRHGHSRKGQRSSNAKLTDKTVQAARLLVADGFSYRTLGAFFGVDAETVRRAVTGEQWGHVGAA